VLAQNEHLSLSEVTDNGELYDKPFSHLVVNNRHLQFIADIRNWLQISVIIL